jgi:hypothetical protein
VQSNTVNIGNSGLSWSGTEVPYSQGHIIHSDNPLITGTPMKLGQSCGNEGNNVYVNSVLPSSVNASYKGCYTDNPSNPTMKFIGGSPPPQSAIVNGNFSQPAIANNSYGCMGAQVNVPGWSGNACLSHNSSAWGYPVPYPAGNQCMTIQGTAYISQTLNLGVGTYTVSFFACGRNCCDKSGKSNPINVQLNGTTFYTCEPPVVSRWNQYSANFNVTQNGNNTLTFVGTAQVDRSTAIQNVSLSGSATAAGTYTYNMCQTAAINGGYRYFALQDVNTQTSKGYCAVSNDSVKPSSGGTSTVISKVVPIWAVNSTQGQAGCTAILSLQGTLSVVQNDTSIYSTPRWDNKKNPGPPNYLGCYGDRPNRAMSLYRGGSQAYNLQSCNDIAIAQGATYFGLQNSGSGEGAQCALSSDLTSTTKYGKASNCTKLKNGTNVGSTSGGGWSNAVYTASGDPTSNYYLILQDDGNMCIYKGTGPTDRQGAAIWATMTTGKQQSPDPVHAASKGKYGKNYITTGQTLAPEDFIGSSDGSIYLKMQTDGNLVLYTSQVAVNCSSMQDGKMGGGQSANAFYDIGYTGFPSDVGKIGYINNDGVLSEYPSSMLKKNSTYTKYANVNSAFNDLGGSAIANTTAEQCQAICDTNDNCGGFVVNNANKLCYPKNKNMNYDTNHYSVNGSDTYVKQPAAPSITSAPGSNKRTANVDSVQWHNYVKSGQKVSNASFDKIAGLTSTQQQQIDQLKGQLNLIAQQITTKTSQLQGQQGTIDRQIVTNNSNINKGTQDFNAITAVDYTKQLNNINHISDDSDIVVLQENYKYLLWSILAITIVSISLKVLKKP